MKKFILPFVLLSLLCPVFAADASDADLVRSGNSMYNQGMYDQAIDSYQKALSINTSNYNAALYCAYAYLKKGDSANALAYLQKAYSLNPTPSIKSKIDALNLKLNPAPTPVQQQEQQAQQVQQVQQVQQQQVQQQQQGPKEDFQDYYNMNSDERFKINKRIGINISGINSNSLHSFSTKTGLSSGLGFIFGYGEFLALQLEAVYTQKGFVDNTTKQTFQIDYGEIPALFKMNFFPIKRMMTGIFIGPEVDFKIKAQETGTQAIEDRYFQLLDYGAVIGVDINYPIAFAWLTLDARFTLGLTNTDRLKDTFLDNPNIKNYCTTFSVGLTF